MFFQNIKRMSVAVTSSNTKLNWKKVPFHTEKARDKWRHTSRKRAERKLKCCLNTT